MNNINSEFGDEHFTYEFHRDKGMTGRLEVTIKDKLVHSKKSSGAYISANWSGFMDGVRDAMI